MGCLTKAKDSSLYYYLPIAEGFFSMNYYYGISKKEKHYYKVFN